ncbi:MAG: hypothetical protein U9O64_04825 [Campylobacterota bacterium]|nr:hypothetical protein [Campylobacterota bacterium]
MSSSLDKLRALTSRLEDKLEEREKSKPLLSSKGVSRNKEPVKPVEKKPVEPVEEMVEKSIEKLGYDHDRVREENRKRVRVLYKKLKIFEKSSDFDTLFIYKAMNLSGIGLKEEDFAQVREGKYIQIIAITYEPDKNGKKKAKNISLGYFGKAETLDATLKNEIIEFVLRWRYEKAFQNVEHYKDLIAKIEEPKNGLIQL